MTPLAMACQVPLSMGFSRHEYWHVLPCPPSRDLPKPGIEPESLMSPALAGGFFTARATWEVPRVGHKKREKQSTTSEAHTPAVGSFVYNIIL